MSAPQQPLFFFDTKGDAAPADISAAVGVVDAKPSTTASKLPPTFDFNALSPNRSPSSKAPNTPFQFGHISNLYQMPPTMSATSTEAPNEGSFTFKPLPDEKIEQLGAAKSDMGGFINLKAPVKGKRSNQAKNQRKPPKSITKAHTDVALDYSSTEDSDEAAAIRDYMENMDLNDDEGFGAFNFDVDKYDHFAFYDTPHVLEKFLGVDDPIQEPWRDDDHKGCGSGPRLTNSYDYLYDGMLYDEHDDESGLSMWDKQDFHGYLQYGIGHPKSQQAIERKLNKMIQSGLVKPPVKGPKGKPTPRDHTGYESKFNPNWSRYYKTKEGTKLMSIDSSKYNREIAKFVNNKAKHTVMYSSLTKADAKFLCELSKFYNLKVLVRHGSRQTHTVTMEKIPPTAIPKNTAGLDAFVQKAGGRPCSNNIPAAKAGKPATSKATTSKGKSPSGAKKGAVSAYGQRLFNPVYSGLLDDTLDYEQEVAWLNQHGYMFDGYSLPGYGRNSYRRKPKPPSFEGNRACGPAFGKTRVRSSKHLPEMAPQVVGASAQPIDTKNKGHKMLSKMGWKPGDSIGASGQGMKEPVKVVKRRERQGLGHH
ncbi:squalene synthetase-like protein [Dimargaris xerosporica]|nr:squalene synthetase-like protein [Dimargaris xerosporica]